jgi:hypothetical protein
LQVVAQNGGSYLIEIKPNSFELGGGNAGKIYNASSLL